MFQETAARLRRQTLVFLIVLGVAFLGKVLACGGRLRGSGQELFSDQVGVLAGVLSLAVIAPMVYFLLAKKPFAKDWTHVTGAVLVFTTTLSFIQAEFLPVGNQVRAARIGPVPAYFLYLLIIGLLWYLLHHVTKADEAVATADPPVEQTENIERK